MINLSRNFLDKTIAPGTKAKFLVGTRMLLTLMTFVLPVTLVTFTETYVVYKEIDIDWNKPDELIDNFGKYETQGYF